LTAAESALAPSRTARIGLVTSAETRRLVWKGS